MSRGMAGRKCGIGGAWLVTTQDDGTTRREPLLTFNPFARPGASASREVKGPTRIAAWHRERGRVRHWRKTRGGPPPTRPVGPRPPRLTADQWRAIRALARGRGADA